MMVRMNGEEVSIEGSTGKANETNMIGARRAAPRRLEFESKRGGKPRGNYANGICEQQMNEKGRGERASELVRAQRGSREKDKTKKKAAKIG